MKYVLIDTSNLFFRARHQTHRASDTWTKLGFALHLTIMSANKVARKFGADHIVFALEGRSWRKDVYPPYKANRKAAALKRTPKEVEEDKVFFEVMEEFVKFVSAQTNCTVLRHPEAEADDMVGVVTGLAWTEVGGELLTIEALRMPGTGKLHVTGQLGDVMRESVDAACSYVRSMARPLRIDDAEMKRTDLHIHFPAGSVPKDGPSAGVAVTPVACAARTP